MSWNDLAPIDDVPPPGPEDLRVLAEIREVLARHGALERFGVTLLHSHFPLADDEVLVESVDVERRSLQVDAIRVP